MELRSFAASPSFGKNDCKDCSKSPQSIVKVYDTGGSDREKADILRHVFQNDSLSHKQGAGRVLNDDVKVIVESNEVTVIQQPKKLNVQA